MQLIPTTRAAVLVASGLALASGELRAQDAERFSIAGNAAVYNLAGSVSIEAGTGQNVVVEVRRLGKDAGKLEIERQEVDGRAALVVRYPDDDVVYRGGSWNGRTTLDVRGDGTFFGNGRGGRRVSIRSSGSGLEAHADLRVLVPAGRTVYVRLGVGDVRATGVRGGVDIDVAAAEVQASGQRGNLVIDTGSGAVRLEDVEGDVSIDTGSGSVTGSNIRAEKVLVDTGSGSITLRSVAAGELELDTGSGSIELDLTSDVERLRIDTGSGGVRLTVPSTLGAELEVDTGSGGIRVDVPTATLRSRERDHVTGSIGDGRGTIAIDTGSGSVRIARR